MAGKKNLKETGQAIVEFALILTVLLSIIFLIIETARILQGWVTVQNAARDGARYATTGAIIQPDCATQNLPKYSAVCANDLRVASVVSVTHGALAGLPLNEDPSSLWEDDNYYLIEVFGGTTDPSTGDAILVSEFAGEPERVVVVRATYRVPIITPIFSAILPSIPVFGQTTLTNEPFGNLGGTGQSAAAPPPLPAIPTVGVTPSPTATPTQGPSPTPSPTPSPSPTATPEPCPVRYTTAIVSQNLFTQVTGNFQHPLCSNQFACTGTFFNITTDPNRTTPIGSATFGQLTGFACPGVAETFFQPGTINNGDIIEVIHEDGSSALTTVQLGTSTPTNTPTPTDTPAPTDTPVPTNTPTPLPPGPFIQISPDCGFAPSSNIFLTAGNWNPNSSVTIFFDNQAVFNQPAGHTGFFQASFGVNVADNTNYTILASDINGNQATATFEVPCQNITATPVTGTPTTTPNPADLVIVGEPIMVNEPPINEYEPVTFQLPITNVGDVDVASQFFVDIYFDPAEVFTDSIPLQYSDGYIAISSLAGQESRVITITSELGFTGGLTDRLVYGMVDSLESVTELDEENNISGPLAVEVTPAASTPTPSPTPDGLASDVIAGRVRSFIGNWVPQFRAIVYLQDETTLDIIATTVTDFSGLYAFTGVPDGTTYTVYACLPTDGADFVGSRTGITPPQPLGNIFMSLNGAGCPVP